MRWAIPFGHQREHAEDEFAVRGGGVHDPVGQRVHPNFARTVSGDDVDEVAQVESESVDLPDEQGVAGAQIGQAQGPLGPVGLGPGCGVFVDFQAAFGPRCVELQLWLLRSKPIASDLPGSSNPLLR